MFTVAPTQGGNSENWELFERISKSPNSVMGVSISDNSRGNQFMSAVTQLVTNNLPRDIIFKCLLIYLFIFLSYSQNYMVKSGLGIYLSIHLSIYSLIYLLSIYSFIYLFTYLSSIYLFIYLSIHLSIYSYIYLFTYLSCIYQFTIR